MILLLLALACSDPATEGGDTGLDLGDGPAELVLPDLSGVDLPAAYVEALALARGITATTAWDGHTTALSRRSTTCPDLYLGGIEDADLGDDAEGVSWLDYCQPAGGGAAFGGWAHWEGSVAVSGQAEDAAGQTVDASRALSGDGLVSVGGANNFELRGEVSESLYRVSAPDYTTWTWQSLVEATVTGSDAFGSQSGWRAELYLSAAGGEAPTLELRGSAYLFEPRIAGRFDSIDADLSFGTDPSCTLEPRGWLSLRDGDAFWYDLVFLPLSDDGSYDSGSSGSGDYGACDGCGTLYIRGLETVEYGTVCPDFASTWALSDDALPDPSTFLLSLREVLAMEGG